MSSQRMKGGSYEYEVSTTRVSGWIQRLNKRVDE